MLFHFFKKKKSYISRVSIHAISHLWQQVKIQKFIQKKKVGVILNQKLPDMLTCTIHLDK